MPSQPGVVVLRIVHIHDAKTLKIRPLWRVLLDYYHLWPLGQKSVKQIFGQHSGCKIIKQNLPGGSDFSDCNTI